MTVEKKRKLHRRSTTIEESSKEKKQKVDKPKQENRVNIGVSINRDLWRELRALAILKGRVTGELLDEAIGNYLNNRENQ